MIGSSPLRQDIQAKMDGSLRYAADMTYEGMLYGLVVRSPVPHGRIRSIHQGPGVDWSRIVFTTAAEIPGKKDVQILVDDMPFLAAEEVRYKGEPIALVAAPTLAEAEAARRAVLVDLDPLPAILTLAQLVHDHCAGVKGLVELARWQINKGNVAQALAAAEVVLEDCYTTPHQEQAYLEPNVMTAVPEPHGCMRVEGSLQCPYYVAPAVAAMLRLDLDHLHVRAFPMGGAFGGKEDFPSQLGGHAAILAYQSGRPVRMALSRAEDMAFTTKRHPSWVKIRAGASRDGALCGLEVDIVLDGGAYVTLSPVVLSRAAIHASGPYSWPAVHINAVAYRSNTPPNGAFRGFGGPQMSFAIESHIDRLALACGLEPHAFRLKNCLQAGDTTATRQRLTESVSAREVLSEALASADLEQKRRQWGRAQITSDDRVARGVGLALYWHGCGFTGQGEMRIAARAALDLRSDGKAHVRVSSTEMGQGSHTVLAQIAAQELRLPLSLVVCDAADTAHVPDSGPTVASRTTMIVGSIIASCARAGREHLLDAIAMQRGKRKEQLAMRHSVIFVDDEPLGPFSQQLQELLKAEGRACWTFEDQYQHPPQLNWDDKTHTGDAYAAFAWGCTVAEVEIELDTYIMRVPKLTTVVDIGRAVNPLLAEGQIEGGMLQALGFALTEEVGVAADGGFLRHRFQTYIIPTAMDAPRMDVRIVEVPYARGPDGAKGLGELPVHGVAPAIANALEHALGIRLRDLPLSPEKIFAAVKERSP